MVNVYKCIYCGYIIVQCSYLLQIKWCCTAHIYYTRCVHSITVRYVRTCMYLVAMSVWWWLTSIILFPSPSPFREFHCTGTHTNSCYYNSKLHQDLHVSHSVCMHAVHNGPDHMHVVGACHELKMNELSGMGYEFIVCRTSTLVN